MSRVWMNDRIAASACDCEIAGERFHFLPVMPGILIDPETAVLSPTQSRILQHLLSHSPATVSGFELRDEIAPETGEATRQALEKAGLDVAAVTKGWVHSGGILDARDTHLAMHGKTVQGLDTPFVLPDGSVMQFPHDPAGGVRNNVNCRCRGDQDIDWAFGLFG